MGLIPGWIAWAIGCKYREQYFGIYVYTCMWTIAKSMQYLHLKWICLVFAIYTHFWCADGDVLIVKFIPLPALLFFIGISFGLILAIFTQRKSPPKYHWVFRQFRFSILNHLRYLYINFLTVVFFRDFFRNCRMDGHDCQRNFSCPFCLRCCIPIKWRYIGPHDFSMGKLYWRYVVDSLPRTVIMF